MDHTDIFDKINLDGAFGERDFFGEFRLKSADGAVLAEGKFVEDTVIALFDRGELERKNCSGVHLFVRKSDVGPVTVTLTEKDLAK